MRHYDTEPSPMPLAELDPALVKEIDDPGFVAFYAREFEGDFLTGNGLQIAWSGDHNRAGIVYVGSGSSGATAWTDATSPADALARYLTDDLRP